MYVSTPLTDICAYVISTAAKFFSYFADAYETAKMLCEQYYMIAPDLEIEEFNGKRKIILSLSTKKMAKKKKT